MTSDKRRAMFRILLPAAALLAAYIWLLGGPKMEQAQTAQEQLAALRARQSAGDQTRLVQAQLQMAGDRLDDLQSDEQALLRRMSAAGGQPQAQRRSATGVVSELTDLITRHDLVVEEDGVVEGSARAALPVYLTPMDVSPGAGKGGAKASAQEPLPTGAAAQLWRVRFIGRYGDAVRMLDALAAAALPVVPLRLDMAESTGDTPLREWTLLIWH